MQSAWGIICALQCSSSLCVVGATVGTGGSVVVGAEGEGAAGEETKKKKKKKKKKGGGGGGGGEATDDYLHPESNPTGQ